MASFLDNVISLAGSWLSGMSNAGISETYTSTKYDVAAHSSINGEESWQFSE